MLVPMQANLQLKPWQLKVHGFYAPGISLHRSVWSKVDRGICFRAKDEGIGEGEELND